jgi:tetratricopeptide (TPR) repeat protein
VTEGRTWLARTLELDTRLGALSAPAASDARLRALKAAGVLARAQGAYAPAEKFFAASLALSQELDDTAATADALYWVAVNGYDFGHRERYRALIEESLALWRRIGDPWGMVRALGPQAFAASQRGDFERAITLQHERLRLAREAEDPWLIANVHLHLGVLAYEQGKHELATEWLEASRRGYEELDDRANLAIVLGHMGRAARARRARSQALQCFGDSLTLHQRLGQIWGVAECLADVAGVLGDLGQFEPTARLMGSAAALRKRLGFQPASRDAARQGQDMRAARATLGATQFDSMKATGERSALDEAIADALNLVSSNAAHLSA